MNDKGDILNQTLLSNTMGKGGGGGKSRCFAVRLRCCAAVS